MGGASPLLNNTSGNLTIRPFAGIVVENTAATLDAWLINPNLSPPLSRFASTLALAFSSGDAVGTSGDVQLSRSGAGVLAVGTTYNNANPALGTLLLTELAFSSGGSGTIDTGISRIGAGVIGVGTGAATSTAGSLIVTTATVSSTLYGGVYWSGSSVGLSETGTALTSITTLGGLVISTSDVSDERLKEGTPYAGGLDTVLAIHPMRYKWNTLGEKETGISHGRPTIGFYAQDVRKAIPEAVWESRNGYLGFDSRPVIAALVNAVKELTARVKQLEATA